MANRRLPPAIPAPPWRTVARPEPDKEPLTRNLILKTALRIIDREGLDALSMRRVAHDLQTGPASLYAHVANKNELLELLIDMVFGEVSVPQADAEHWQEKLRELAFELRRALTRHGDIARLVSAFAPCGPNGVWVAEAFLSILRAAGLSDQECGWAVGRLTLYITADALEVSQHFSRGRATEPNVEAHWRRLGDYYSSLPPQHFPHTTAMAETLLSGSGDARFEFGLDLLMHGLKIVCENQQTTSDETPEPAAFVDL